MINSFPLWQTKPSKAAIFSSSQITERRAEKCWMWEMIFKKRTFSHEKNSFIFVKKIMVEIYEVFGKKNPKKFFTYVGLMMIIFYKKKTESCLYFFSIKLHKLRYIIFPKTQTSLALVVVTYLRAQVASVLCCIRWKILYFCVSRYFSLKEIFQFFSFTLRCHTSTVSWCKLCMKL